MQSEEGFLLSSLQQQEMEKEGDREETTTTMTAKTAAPVDGVAGVQTSAATGAASSWTRNEEGYPVSGQRVFLCIRNEDGDNVPLGLTSFPVADCERRHHRHRQAGPGTRSTSSGSGSGSHALFSCASLAHSLSLSLSLSLCLPHYLFAGSSSETWATCALSLLLPRPLASL